MAYAKILVTNGIEVKMAPIGFSWTVFLFGGFPALFRQDWLMAILIFAANFFTWGIFGMVFGFFYNKIYLKSLLSRGYWIHKHDAMTTDVTITEYVGFLKLPEAR